MFSKQIWKMNEHDYPLVNKQFDPENHSFLLETSLPTPMTARVVMWIYQRVIHLKKCWLFVYLRPMIFLVFFAEIWRRWRDLRDRHGTIEVSCSSGLGNWRRTCSLTTLRWMISWINIWLVVWNMNGLWLSHHIGNVIVPTDELTPSFFRGVGIPTTKQIHIWLVVWNIFYVSIYWE